ncbi:MAG: hypothetical protein PHW75_03400 [Patescibacteria group bacterium]|nr:hypothetical protein [Patescibacteria group bacterium]
MDTPFERASQFLGFLVREAQNEHMPKREYRELQNLAAHAVAKDLAAGDLEMVLWADLDEGQCATVLKAGEQLERDILRAKRVYAQSVLAAYLKSRPRPT